STKLLRIKPDGIKLCRGVIDMQTVLTNQNVELIYDREITISNYNSLNDKYTKMETLKYSDFVNKFVEPLIIENTDYVSLFIAGYVDGKRGKENVKDRSILMIDIDTEQKIDVITTLRNNFPYAWFIHTSYSSTPKLKKYHLGIPLKESISPNQYKYLTK